MAEQELGSEQELGPEELLEGIRRMKVSDVLLSAFSTVAQLGYAKLEPPTRDLDTRPPVVWVTYAGHQVKVFSGLMAGRKAVGPRRLRPESGQTAPTWPVVAVWLHDRQSTVVGFSPTSPPGVLGDWDAIHAERSVA